MTGEFAEKDSVRYPSERVYDDMSHERGQEKKTAGDEFGCSLRCIRNISGYVVNWF